MSMVEWGAQMEVSVLEVQGLEHLLRGNQRATISIPRRNNNLEAEAGVA